MVAVLAVRVGVPSAFFCAAALSWEEAKICSQVRNGWPVATASSFSVFILVIRTKKEHVLCIYQRQSGTEERIKQRIEL